MCPRLESLLRGVDFQPQKENSARDDYAGAHPCAQILIQLPEIGGGSGLFREKKRGGHEQSQDDDDEKDSYNQAPFFHGGFSSRILVDTESVTRIWRGRIMQGEFHSGAVHQRTLGMRSRSSQPNLPALLFP